MLCYWLILGIVGFISHGRILRKQGRRHGRWCDKGFTRDESNSCKWNNQFLQGTGNHS